MDINKLVGMAYQNAKQHGFHEERKSNEHFLMMIISEVCEVMEAHRKGKAEDQKESFTEREYVHPDFGERYEAYIKGTMAEELADMCIRTFDFMGLNGITEKDILGSCLTNDELAKCNDKFSLTEQAFELIAAITHHLHLPVICHIVIAFAKYWAKKYCIDLEWHIMTKMKYNRNRPTMHNNLY